MTTPADTSRKTTGGVNLSIIEASAVDEGAVALPPELYVSDEYYNFERKAIFERGWICLGRAEQISKPGDFFTVTVLDEPLIVVRTNEHKVNVMSSVCRHKGMCITNPAERPTVERLAPPPESSGHVQSFKCPYHWWTYDLEGKLIGAPEMTKTPGFVEDEVRLPSPKVELWRGFIFVNFDHDAEPLAPQLKQLDDILADYPMEEMVTVNSLAGANDVPFNWKIMVENAMDDYHTDRLHEGIHDFAPAGTGPTLPLLGDSSVLINQVHTPHIDAGANPTFNAFFPYHPLLTEEERSRVLYVLIAPTLFLSIYADLVGWLTIYPTGPTTHDQAWNILVHPEATEMENFEALVGLRGAAMEQFNQQDLPVDVSVQKGMRSRYAVRGKLSWQEGFMPQFSKWYLRELRRFEKDEMA